MSNSGTICRYRTGHGAKNMAIVRRFALGLVRASTQKAASRHDEKPPWSPTPCYKSFS
jgi:hypothetical protein